MAVAWAIGVCRGAGDSHRPTSIRPACSPCARGPGAYSAAAASAGRRAPPRACRCRSRPSSRATPRARPSAPARSSRRCTAESPDDRARYEVSGIWPGQSQGLSNPGAPRSAGAPGPLRAAPAQLRFRVPYVGYQAVGLQGTAYNLISNYNSIQITARKQFSHGFVVQAAYTFSKSLTNENGLSANGNDPLNTMHQYGPSYFNRPSRFIMNYSWDLPFGKHTGVLGGVLGGWNLLGVTTVQSGELFTVIDSAAGTIYGRRSCPSGRSRSPVSCRRRPSGSSCHRPSWAGKNPARQSQR